MKKQICALTMTAALLGCTLLTAGAAPYQTEFYLSPVGMTVEIPEEFYVFTQDNLEEQREVLESFNVDPDAMASYLTDDVLLNAWNENWDKELVMYYDEDAYIEDYWYLTDEELQTELEEWVEVYEEDQELSNYYLYWGNYTPYVVLLSHDSDANVAYAHCITVAGGNVIQMILSQYEVSEIPTALEYQLFEIMDDTEFDDLSFLEEGDEDWDDGWDVVMEPDVDFGLIEDTIVDEVIPVVVGIIFPIGLAVVFNVVVKNRRQGATGGNGNRPKSSQPRPKSGTPAGDDRWGQGQVNKPGTSNNPYGKASRGRTFNGPEEPRYRNQSRPTEGWSARSKPKGRKWLRQGDNPEDPWNR